MLVDYPKYFPSHLGALEITFIYNTPAKFLHHQGALNICIPNLLSEGTRC